jgi:hypothetical protein
VLERGGHQAGVAGAVEQVLQAGQEFVTAGGFGDQAGADARAERDQFLAAQFLGQAGVAGEDHAQECLGVEPGAGHQAQFGQDRGTHFLGFVDQEHRAPAGGVQMREPVLAQGLEAAPAVVRAQGDAEEVAHLAVEVGQLALRMMDGDDGEIGQPCQAFRGQAQDHALAGAGVAVDHGEAGFADQAVFDAPVKVLDACWHIERLDRDFGGERVPLQPIEGQ